MRDEMGLGPEPASPRPSSSEDQAPDSAALIDTARRDATTEGRLAAVSLTLFPVVIAILLLAFDDNTAAAVRSAFGIVILLAAAVLTVAGAWWLWSIAAPPFAAFPGRRSILERQPQTAYELSVIFQEAASYAGQGMGIADALDRAAPTDVSHPSRVLAEGLRVLLEPGADVGVQHEDGHPEQPPAGGEGENHAGEPSPANDEASSSAADEARSELPDWLIYALLPGWEGQQPGGTDRDPVESLHLVAVRIRAELEAAAYAWPARVRVATLVPFLVCMLPAATLLALLANV